MIAVEHEAAILRDMLLPRHLKFHIARFHSAAQNFLDMPISFFLRIFFSMLRIMTESTVKSRHSEKG